MVSFVYLLCGPSPDPLAFPKLSQPSPTACSSRAVSQVYAQFLGCLTATMCTLRESLQGVTVAVPGDIVPGLPFCAFL